MTDTLYFTTGDGCRIAYQLAGAGPVLVLSNSIATNLHMWDRQLAELAGSFRVLRYDLRGHGSSDAPAGAYSLDRLGRDVLELLDALQIARVHFCGLSLGGFVGQWLGIHAPDRIERLSLSNTSPHLGPASYFDEQIRTVLAASNMSAAADMFMHNWFPASMLAGPNETVDAFRAMVLATPPQGLAGCFAAVRDCDLRRTVSLITAPTLVIGGEDDKVTLASHSEAIAASIPGATLTLLPGVHMLNVERPTEFMSAVTRFLLN
ncbi:MULTISPECIES: alpha/beta fold hydrolase [unclassified Mesorhizobium]|uniref:alpha/beta fold hydrolase n=1 Tax=unclassified Mesorhizobium TaxID=325217 RepID=UPI0003CF92B1|nr:MULTISPECIES: alpha/beta fold hydrolase [unclassified Mesorhizobium]ESY48265.1 3-oxoadipate enol-lactonase [Mesorhizobium sp. LNJC374B00]ESY54816.1 3-oxoadipate enol-lactonase [Mesorhizobium sp. LNJC372A00]ESZ43796.1 3-oxoadipate enol-lactonase [Mesorhizobium sp. L2C054A000]WJI81712.1 alpha/beta fold hydrolase [Mesorhizobium sp. C374B]WJI88230.1 alpha/beta fold hydrolase [Mesorhizobium sp. C372A]